MSIDAKELKVLEYLEGELSAEEEQAFLAEVASDRELAGLLEEYQQQDRVLHAWFDSREAVVQKAPRPNLAALPSAQVEVAVARRRRNTQAWALAASLVAGAGAGVFFMMPRPTPSAVDTIVYAEGQPLVYEPKAAKPESLGAQLPAEVAALRTPARSQLEVGFAGGMGTFEMKENSTVRVAEMNDAVELSLDRGEVIVFARNAVDAEKTQTVQVHTPYFQVHSDRGTFNVVRGLKGAEVAVVSGEVELRAEGSRRKLTKGESYSSTGVDPMPMLTRVEWSRHSDQLVAMLPQEELLPQSDVLAMAAPAKANTATAAAGTVAVRDTATAAPAEPAVYSVPAVSAAATTNFLPPDTLTVLEIPSVPKLLESSGKRNFAEALFGSGLRGYIEDSAANAIDSAEEMEELNKMLDSVFSNEDLSLALGSLGGSITIGVSKTGPVLVADVTDNYAAMAELINGKVDSHINERQQGDDRLWLGVENGRLVIAVGKEQFEATVGAVRSANPTAFAYSPFLTELRQTVPGSYFTVALDAKKLFSVATSTNDENNNRQASRIFQNLGLANMQSVIAATSFRDQAQNQALRVTFDGERQGLMSWLDTPGPMNAFQFYSPDTHALIAMRVKTPAVILDEFFGWIEQGGGAVPETDPETELVRTIVATLGNEAAIGLDNPVLPTPNVKIAIEAVDPEGFHNAMIELITMLDANNGEGQQVEVNAADYREHMVVDFTYPGSKLGVSYAIVGDYVVLGPGRASVQGAIDIFTEGQSLNNEYAFQQALPPKSGSYCSLLMYAAHNASMGEAAPLLTEIFRQNHIPVNVGALGSPVTAGPKATVAYIIAEENQIDLFVEGIRGEYAMGGLIPAVAGWIETNGAE